MKQRIWAHRGSSKEAPENTMAAFRLAVADGADGIEIDVQFTKDLEIVVIHDEFLDRLTGVSGIVPQMTYEELMGLNVAYHRQDLGEVHQIPRLKEVLELLRGTDVVLNIELKNSTFLMPGLEEAVVSLVSEYEMTEQVIYSSFNHYSIKTLVDMGYGQVSGLLFGAMWIEPWTYAKELGVAAIHPLLTNLQLPDYVQGAHEAGIKIHAWTIDEPEHIALALALNIDAIITNVPKTALMLRDKQK